MPLKFVTDNDSVLHFWGFVPQTPSLCSAKISFKKSHGAGVNLVVV